MRTVLIDQPTPEICRITLNRPERLNAMDRTLVDDLHDAFDTIQADSTCRVVLLTGAGRGFCAGLDIKGGGLVADEGLGRVQGGMRWQQRIASLITKMRGLSQPIIAAVNGAASGGGLALALASDIRIASPKAKFNVAFVKIGLSGCDVGVSYLLPRLIGASRAFELMLTGRMVQAEEAEKIGLVSRIVPEEELLDSALETASLITANSPFGVWMTKEVMWSNLEVSSLHAAIDMENRTQILSAQTADMVEALRSFTEKRPPKFENR